MRALLLAALFVGLVPVQPPSRAQDHPVPNIVGSWRLVHAASVDDQGTSRIKHYKAPESVKLEYRPDGTWTLANEKLSTSSAGTYKWLPSGELEQTITESTSSASVGRSAVRAASVEGGRLTLVESRGAANSYKTLPGGKVVASGPNERIEVVIYRKAQASDL